LNENREFYAEILKDDQYIPVAMEVKDLRKVKNELYLVDFFVQYKDGHSEEVKDFKIIKAEGEWKVYITPDPYKYV